MLAAIERMRLGGDADALAHVWQLLGGESELRGTEKELSAQYAELIIPLVHRLCGKGDLYAAERAAVAEVAKTAGVDARKYPNVEDLEDAVLERLGERLREKLDGLTDEERLEFFEGMVKRMSDEERIRLIDQVLEGYDEMSEDEQQHFRHRLAAELGVDDDQLLIDAIAGGAATLIPLLLAKQSGFAIFLWTTRVMAAGASSVGVVIPFGVYMFKNRALGWLLGPMGMLVTTALSAGWFFVASWRRKERFRKLVQLIAYTAAWRDPAD